jgi:hypothetical protein
LLALLFVPVQAGAHHNVALYDASRIVTTDPATFTEPVPLEKYWLWHPEVTVEPYRCKP